MTDGVGHVIRSGGFAVAGLGTAFLCTTLLLLDKLSTQKARATSVEILASGRQFPATHVENVFARNTRSGIYATIHAAGTPASS